MEKQKIENELESLKQALRNSYFMNVQQQITILNALKEKFGSEVEKIVEESNGKNTCQTYIAKAKDLKEKNIDNLIEILWEPLRERGFEFTAERVENGVQMKCTVCPLANLYKTLGGTNWGYHLCCAADFYLVEGFNPKISLKRTKTIMEGHDCCDHLYLMKE